MDDRSNPMPDSGPKADASSRDDAGARDDAGSGNDAGVSPNACLPGSTPRMTAGAGGGPIAGSVTVFVLDSRDNRPIEGARVVIQKSTMRVEASTDPAGCVRFASAEVASGPVDVHIFAAGRPYDSLFGLEAAEVTTSLAPPLDQGFDPPVATIAGMITNLEVTTATTSTVAGIAIMNPIEDILFGGGPAQPARVEDPRVGQNVAAIGGFGNFAFRDYRLVVFPDVHHGVFAVAGKFTTPRFGQGTFTPTHVGLIDGLTLVEGEDRTGQDVELSLRLEEMATIGFEALNEPQTRFAGLVVTLPSGHYLVPASTNPASGATFVALDAPRLEGALLGATYGAVVQEGNPTSFRRRVVLRNATPNIDVGPLPPLPSLVRASGRSIDVTLDSGAHMGFVFALQGEVVIWRALSLGQAASRTLAFPEVPANFDDPLVGPRSVVLQSRTFDRFDPKDFDLGELARVLTGIASTQASVTFPDPNRPNPLACTTATPGPIDGPGFEAGPISGSVTAHVLAAEDDTPLADTTVVFSAGNETITGRTDGNGCASLVRLGLSGPLDVHFFAPGRTYLSIVRVNASRMLVRLERPGTPASFAADEASIEGMVTGLDVLSTTTATTARIAFVETIDADLFSEGTPTPAVRPNSAFGTNVAVTGSRENFDFRDYSLRVNAFRALGLFIRGGTLDTVDSTIELSHLGITPDLALMPGEARQDVPAALIAPIDQPFTVSHPLSALPTTLTLGLIVFPGGGLAVLDASQTSTDSAAFEGPAFTGLFTGAHFGGAVQFSGGEGEGVQVEIDTSDQGAMIVLSPPPLPSGIGVSGREVRATLDPRITDQAIVVLQTQQQPRWAILHNAPAPAFSVTLPAVPDGLTDPARGVVRVRVEGRDYSLGTNLDDISYRKREHLTRLRALAGIAQDATF